MRKYVTTLFALVAVTSSAQNSTSTPKAGVVVSPQVQAVLSSPQSQDKITNCADAIREVRWGKTTRITYTSEGLAVAGLDDSGRAWNTTVPASNVLKCEVWATSLERGSRKSLLFLKTPEDGGIYGGELTILSFDKQGMPTPWTARGGFTSTATGITQIVSDQSTGGISILVPHRSEDAQGNFAYATALFKGDDSGFAKIVGKDKTGASWPDVQGNRDAITASEFRSTRTLSNRAIVASDGSSLTISKVHPKEDEPVTYSNGSTSRYPKMVVWDKADQSRSIYLDEYVIDAVNESLTVGAKITLRGTACEDDECGPFLMNASSN